MLKVFGKSILNGVFEQIHLLTTKYLKYQNTKYSICSISNTKYVFESQIPNTYLKYKYFKYCPPLSVLLDVTFPSKQSAHIQFIHHHATCNKNWEQPHRRIYSESNNKFPDHLASARVWSCRFFIIIIINPI